MKYAVIIEKGPTSYGATVPDLPGCTAVGETLEEVEELIREAIEFHMNTTSSRSVRLAHYWPRSIHTRIHCC